MTARSFGRKGNAAPVMASPTGASGFGRAGAAASASDAGGDDIAARREAFIAEERKRSISRAEPSENAPVKVTLNRQPQPTDRQPHVAYGLWLMFGLVGAHRHYLGLHVTALVQTCLFVVALMTLLTFDSIAFVAFAIGGLWLAADMVMLPMLCRAANVRSDQKRAFAGI